MADQPAGRSLYSTYLQVQAVTDSPSREDAAALLPLVGQTHQDLLALDAELRPFYGLMKRLDWLPRVGGDVAAGPALIELGIHLTQAGDTLLTAMRVRLLPPSWRRKILMAKPFCRWL